MAVTRWVKAALADATAHATWQASWPSRERRLLVGVGLSLLVGGTVVLVAAASGRSWMRLIGQVALFVGILVAMVGQQRTYRATDRGLEIQHPLARRLVPWSTLQDYRLTEEALVLRRTRPLSPGFRFDRDALEDEDAVVSALEGHLERR